MKIDQKIITKFDELIEAGKRVLNSRRSRSGPGYTVIGDDAVNPELSNQWGISCLNILGRVLGKDSDHYKRFHGLFSQFDDYTPVLTAQGILNGAKSDYEDGFLFETRTLIQAEVFDDFLEEAKHLLDNSYHAPAAVIAGSVLEDGLRKLSIRKGITLSAKPKLDTMNAELAKSGAYNMLTQKKITALADLRNKAAHGKWTEFTAADVEQMIVQIRAFMEDHFT
ncbi:MAG TPA: hypothetical protein VMZ30_11265 [Pyrinomonadaceae bacterium]|nr:hypothetical protein [Pyrinomonadaceae bacterium]